MCIRDRGGKETAISPAGSNARSSRAAARARNQSAAGSASSPRASVPKVVTTRLFKRGRLIETAPSNVRPSAPPPPQPLSGLIYSDDDEKDLNAVDDDDEERSAEEGSMHFGNHRSHKEFSKEKEASTEGNYT